jgi:hypothetical protein
MTTGTVDAVMVALEETCQYVPAAQENWAMPHQVASLITEITPKGVQRDLDELVELDRAERKITHGAKMYRPVRGGGRGFGSSNGPRGAEYTPPGQDGFPDPRGGDKYPDEDGKEFTGMLAVGAGGGAGGAASSSVSGIVRNVL